MNEFEEGGTGGGGIDEDQLGGDGMGMDDEEMGGGQLDEEGDDEEQ